MLLAQTETILIVDDDPGVATLERRRLERAGYEAVTALTAEDALDQLLADGIALIVLDNRLSGTVDGLDLYAQLKKAGRNVPAILVTGFSDETTVIRALREGVRDFVCKTPDFLDHLPNAVARVLLQVRTEKQLAASEAQKAAIMEASVDAILTMDSKGNIQSINPAAAKMFGYTENNALGESLVELIIPPAFRGHYRQDLRHFSETGEAPFLGKRLESTAMRADGSEFPAEIAVTRIPIDGPAMFTWFVRDITERKQGQDALRESEDRLRQITENISEVLFLTDAGATKMLYVSRAYEKLWGRSCQSLYESPRSWLDGVHADDRPAVVGFLDKHNRGVIGILDYRVVQPTGSVRFARLRTYPIKSAAGTEYRLVGVIEDITEQRQLEEKFRQAQKMEAVGRLAGGIAHDFNNLLTIIGGYSEILLSEIRSGDPFRELIEQIRRAGERAAGLTRQLLTFSRKQLLVPSILDLNAILTDMEKMLRRLIGEDIDLRVTLRPDIGPIKADPGQIEQVVMNLVVNARDAMPMGGKLTVQTENVELDPADVAANPEARPGSYVLLSFTDTGTGMDAATKSRIFEPFFTTKEPERGTGLGLATVYGIVQQSGGHIAVDTEMGIGTTFKIYFRREETKGDQSKARGSGRRASRGTETVLVVEDEEGVRALLRMILQNHGYRVLEARHGAEALALCEKQLEPIHLIVSDVVMPQMSGRELAERLRTILPNIKVLYVSGYTDDAILRHGILQEGLPFLQKPFTPEALARKVREVLG